jgi:hypothetical protein
VRWKSYLLSNERCPAQRPVIRSLCSALKGGEHLTASSAKVCDRAAGLTVGLRIYKETSGHDLGGVLRDSLRCTSRALRRDPRQSSPTATLQKRLNLERLDRLATEKTRQSYPRLFVPKNSEKTRSNREMPIPGGKSLLVSCPKSVIFLRVRQRVWVRRLKILHENIIFPHRKLNRI